MSAELKLVQQQIIGLNQDAVDEWSEYRQEKKKPLSALAMKKVIKFLLKYDEGHQQALVDAAIMNDWQGLHDIEIKKQTSRESTLHDDLNDTSWAR